MADPEFSRQLENDRETLRLVLTGMEALEAQWRRAQTSVAARQRGYFTPDEDDWVRRMLLSYRNYRMALYELIDRYHGYRKIPEPEQQLYAFLLGLATALVLYSYSLKMIQTYEREPLVRAKLNEPDTKFGVGEGFFEEVLRSYSSLRNYQELIRGIWFWQAHRREIQKAAATPEWKWVIDLIRRERVLVRRRLVNVLWCRLRYDWRTFWQTTIRPVRQTRYSMQSLIGDACANVRTTRSYQPALTAAVLGQLKPLLVPGDVLLVRAEQKLTSALLPGFWAHAALYIGDRTDMEALGIATHRHVTPHLEAVQRETQAYGAVIEAISPRVLVNSLEHCLLADHVLVLRPNLPRDEIAAAITEAFGHVGKPYDFEFDFNVSSRLVCTEIIYRSYHKRGAIAFSLLKRLGRFTLTADDIAQTVLEQINQAPAHPPFSVTALALKMADGHAQLLATTEGALATLRRIHQGWRPGQPEPAPTAETTHQRI